MRNEVTIDGKINIFPHTPPFCGKKIEAKMVENRRNTAAY